MSMSTCRQLGAVQGRISLPSMDSCTLKKRTLMDDFAKPIQWHSHLKCQ